MSGRSGQPDSEGSEAAEVRARYARRDEADPRYSLTQPAHLAAHQERQRAIVALLRRIGRTDLPSLRLLEVGSGGGGNLLDLLGLGFLPAHLCGIELLPQRHAMARERLPGALRLACGDASVLPIDPASADIVLQATVFSSLLEDASQEALAAAMWRAVKPGGGVLWYDFVIGNPRNRDVRAVPVARVRALFPEARAQFRSLTLAPPLARAVTRLHPALYTLFNTLPLLRTHVLGWLAKPL